MLQSLQIVIIKWQLIELWETFLMQLDADEDGEPFFKPPSITPAPVNQRVDDRGSIESQTRQQDESEHDLKDQSHEATAAAATIQGED